MHKHLTTPALNHLLTLHHLNPYSDQTLLLLGRRDTFYSILGHFLCQCPLLRRLTWLESLADGTEKALFSHFIAVVAKLEVLGPLVMALVPSDLPVTVLALDAILTAIAPCLHVLFSDQYSVLIHILVV